MVDILVRPPELRNVSEQLRSSAQRISQALEIIDNHLRSLKSQNFLGNRADNLQAHYAAKREALLRARELVLYFSKDLQTAAEVFEKADFEKIISRLPISAGPLLDRGWALPLVPILPSDWRPKFSWPILPILPFLLKREKGINLPVWLTKQLDRVFGPAEIVSPLADEKVDTTAPSTTGFGELLKQSPSAPAPTATASANISSASKLDITYAVPTKAQGTLYGSAACAPTSVSMVLDYFHGQDVTNQTVSPEQLLSMMDKSDGTSGSGISLSNLTDELNDIGYHNISQQVNADFSDLRTAVQNGPVIVTAGVKIAGTGTITGEGPRTLDGPGNTIHAMVVTGISDVQVNVNDPWTGSELQFSKDKFEAMWSRGSSALYAIRP